MIINPRGTSGSGKSTLGHWLINTFSHEEIYEDGWNKTKPKLIGYRLPGNLIVLGPYRANGGGMDLISSGDRSKHYDLIKRYWNNGENHVFFEALVTSSTVPQYVKLSEELEPITFAFLDTPVDTCIANVYHRNGGKPIKEDNIRGHHGYMTRVAQRLRDAGQTVVTIRHEHAAEDLANLLVEGGWDPWSA